MPLSLIFSFNSHDRLPSSAFWTSVDIKYANYINKTTTTFTKNTANFYNIMVLWFFLKIMFAIKQFFVYSKPPWYITFFSYYSLFSLFSLLISWVSSVTWLLCWKTNFAIKACKKKSKGKKIYVINFHCT